MEMNPVWQISKEMQLSLLSPVVAQTEMNPMRQVSKQTQLSPLSPVAQYQKEAQMEMNPMAIEH